MSSKSWGRGIRSGYRVPLPPPPICAVLVQSQGWAVSLHMRWACAAPHCRGSEQCRSSTVPWTAPCKTPAPGCSTWKSYPICRGRQCNFLFSGKSELTPQLIFLNLLVQFRQISKISMLFMNTLSVPSDQNFHIWGTASPESQVVYQWGGRVSPHPAFWEHFSFSFTKLSGLGDTFLWNNGIYFRHFRKSAPKLDLNRNSEFLVASPQFPVPPHTLTGCRTATRP